MSEIQSDNESHIKERFRGFLPVVVDIETAGIDPNQHALLEICMVMIHQTPNRTYHKGQHYFEHVLPFKNAKLDPDSLAFTGIDPFQPLRFAVTEKKALESLFKPIKTELKKTGCQRAVLVGHNAWFDLLFLKAACQRTGIKSPFHAFTCFDTATLSGLMFGQTVLAKAVQTAKISFDKNEAHSAIYDAEKTAELFCKMLNDWESMTK